MENDRGRFVVQLRFEATDGRIYEIAKLPYAETTAAQASGQAWSVATDLRSLFGGLQIENDDPCDKPPALWRPMIPERKARILEAILHMQAREEGFKLGPDVKSMLGEKIKILNQQNPGLNLTLEELLPLAEEFARIAFEESFKPSRRVRRNKK
ncbi:MAG TPA: hypothetical protein VD998_04100 [Verrucomicrobiae bacterium]|nr:hypothetical protein [Verrucomicrobiae bacterium]